MEAPKRERLTTQQEREALLAIYAIERQDDQSVTSVRTALLAATIALLGGLGLALLRDPTHTPGWLFAVIPVLPVPLFGWTAMFLARGELRHRHIVQLEVRLSELIPRRLGNAPVASHHCAAFKFWVAPVPALFSALALFVPFLFVYCGICYEAVRRAAIASDEPLALGVCAFSGAVIVGFIGLLGWQQRMADRLLASL